MSKQLVIKAITYVISNFILYFTAIWCFNYGNPWGIDLPYIKTAVMLEAIRLVIYAVRPKFIHEDRGG